MSPNSRTAAHLRLAGWIVLAFGALALLTGLAMLSSPDEATPSPPDSLEPPEVSFLFAHPEWGTALEFSLGVVLTAGGLGLLFRRNWGRLIVMSFSALWIAYGLWFSAFFFRGLLVGMRLQDPFGIWMRSVMTVMSFVMLASEVILLALLIRWLHSPAVRAACLRRSPPPTSSPGSTIPPPAL